jgi:hypothetical protein
MATTPGDFQQAHRARVAPVAPIAAGCCLVAGAAYVAAVDPSEGGVYPICPFRAITGWWCPGCGLTRATHHLLHGDLADALRFNLLVVPVLALIGAVWAGWYLRSTGRPVGVLGRLPGWAYVAATSGLVAFAVVRNLPGIDGLRG